MLHLQAGVHFQKVEVPVLVHEELDSAGAFVIAGQRCFDRCFTHGLAQFGCHEGRGRFFHHLLVPTLNGAIPLAQVHGVAVPVRENLNLYMAGLNHGFFKDQLVVAEGLFGFRPGPFNVVGQFGFALNQAHAPASPAGGSLDHQGIANVFCGGDEFVVAGVVPFITGYHGDTGLLHGDFGPTLAAHQFDSRGWRANEDQAGIFAGIGEGGILGEEAVARVDAVGAGFAGGLEDGIAVQVGGGHLCRANADGFVGHFYVHGSGVGLGVDGHGAVTQGFGSFDDTNCDFASVGY